MLGFGPLYVGRRLRGVEVLVLMPTTSSPVAFEQKHGWFLAGERAEYMTCCDQMEPVQN